MVRHANFRFHLFLCTTILIVKVFWSKNGRAALLPADHSDVNTAFGFTETSSDIREFVEFALKVVLGQICLCLKPLAANRPHSFEKKPSLNPPWIVTLGDPQPFLRSLQKALPNFKTWHDETKPLTSRALLPKHGYIRQIPIKLISLICIKWPILIPNDVKDWMITNMLQSHDLEQIKPHIDYVSAEGLNFKKKQHKTAGPFSSLSCTGSTLYVLLDLHNILQMKTEEQ